MTYLLTIQHELDRLAAEHGATHAALSCSTLDDGTVFYTVSFHRDRVVRCAHGDTLAEALVKAIDAKPFDARPKPPALSEAEMAELIAGDEAAERRAERAEQAERNQEAA